MNPLADFTEKEFHELDHNELIQVMNSYCDENKYPISFEHQITYNKTSRENAIIAFQKEVGDISILKTYFNNWTK